MSHTSGQVLDAAGKIVGHFEYNGTVDVARPKIFATVDDLTGAWRQPQPDPCACVGVGVALVTEDFRWDGRACLEHGFIVHGCGRAYDDEDDAWPLRGKRKDS